jgi:hypothetical protein
MCLLRGARRGFPSRSSISNEETQPLSPFWNGVLGAQRTAYNRCSSGYYPSSQGNSCCSIAVAYNVFSTVTCGVKTARLWFAEEAMAG